MKNIKTKQYEFMEKKLDYVMNPELIKEILEEGNKEDLQRLILDILKLKIVVVNNSKKIRYMREVYLRAINRKYQRRNLFIKF